MATKGLVNNTPKQVDETNFSPDLFRLIDTRPVALLDDLLVRQAWAAANGGVTNVGHTPSTAGTFQKNSGKINRKDPTNALRALPGIPLESTAGISQAL